MRNFMTMKIFKKASMFLLFVLVSLFAVQIDASAETYTDDYVCIMNRVVKIIPNDPTEITDFDKITATDVFRGHIPYPADIEDEDKPLYQFKVDASSGKSCRITGTSGGRNVFEMCPTTAEATQYSISRITSSSNMTITYNSFTGKYDIVFKNASGIKITMANKVNGVFEINSLGEPDSILASNIGAGNSGTITISLAPGTDFYFVFYLSSGACVNARLGYYQGATPETIPNPYYKTGICSVYTSKYADGSLGAELVPDCYKEKVLFSSLGTLQATILSSIATANTLLGSRVTSSANENITQQCQFRDITGSNISNTTQTYTYSDFLDLGKTTTYWKAYCTEEITISYDSPQAVNAGAGFAYSAKISMKRTCKPVQVATPQYYALCNYTVECYGGPANHNGEPGAGPTEEFDECINTCDGGKYSQDCINTCNTEIYGDAVGTSSVMAKYGVTFLSTTTFNQAKAIKLAVANLLIYDDATSCSSLIGKTVYTRLPQSSCSPQDSNSNCGGDGSTYCISKHGVKFTYLDGCNTNGTVSGTKCYEVFKNYPCVQDNATNRTNLMGSASIPVDPFVAYKNKVDEATSELAYVESVISTYTAASTTDEKFRALIKDSYTNKTVTLSTLDVKANIALVAKNFIESKQIAAPLGSVTDVNRNIYEYVVTRDVTINLPKAYVPSFSTSDEVKYLNNTTNKDPSTSGTTSLYYDGGNKYYTNLYSPSINSYLNWRSYEDFNNNYIYEEGNSSSVADYTNNIALVFNNVGSWNQLGNANNSKNVTLNCFYGLINQYCTECAGVEDEISLAQSCNPSTDICTSGMQYVFRTISLSDMFPSSETYLEGRDPRWNWSNASKLTLFGDNIDPVAYTTEVEDETSSNNNIYDNSNSEVGKDNNPELDYEIFLSKENVKSIKYYNTTKDSYLDFDATCIKNANGKVVCESDFIGNSEYMTVYKSPSKSGCNNNEDSDTCEN